MIRCHLHTLPTLPTLEAENQILLGDDMRNPKEHGHKKQRWEGNLQSNKTTYCIKLGEEEHRGWREVWHDEREARRRPQRGKQRQKRHPRDRKGKRFELKHSEPWEIFSAESLGKLYSFCAFYLVPLLSQLTHLFSIFFPVLILVGVPVFSIFFFRLLIVLMFLSTSRRLGLKREARETVRKLGKDGHN